MCTLSRSVRSFSKYQTVMYVIKQCNPTRPTGSHAAQETLQSNWCPRLRLPFICRSASFIYRSASFMAQRFKFAIGSHEFSPLGYPFHLTRTCETRQQVPFSTFLPDTGALLYPALTTVFNITPQYIGIHCNGIEDAQKRIMPQRSTADMPYAYTELKYS